MTNRTDEDLATLLRVRCTSGGSEEREIICRAADKLDELEKDLGDALRLLGGKMITTAADEIARMHAENTTMRASLDSIRVIVNAVRDFT